MSGTSEALTTARPMMRNGSRNEASESLIKGERKVKVITALLEALVLLVKLIVASKKKRLTFTFPFVHHQSHDWKVEH